MLVTLSSYLGKSDVDLESGVRGFLISGSNVNSQSSQPPQLSTGELTPQNNLQNINNREKLSNIKLISSI